METTRIGLTDAAALAALHAEGFAGSAQEPWKGEAIAALLALPGAFGFRVATHGFVLARVAADECEILTLAVAGAARRRGIARALMAAACDEAGARGAGAVFLEVGADNAPARGLYQSLGFAERGRRAKYYAGREDAIIMARDL